MALPIQFTNPHLETPIDTSNVHITTSVSPRPVQYNVDSHDVIPPTITPTQARHLAMSQAATLIPYADHYGSHGEENYEEFLARQKRRVDLCLETAARIEKYLLQGADPPIANIGL